MNVIHHVLNKLLRILLNITLQNILFLITLQEHINIFLKTNINLIF
jgi:hypothetical protein